MANTKSAVKRARQSEERNLRNRHYKSRVKSAIKSFERVAEDSAKGTEALRKATSELDRAVSKGVIHKNVARRKKSSLARMLNSQGDAGS